MILTPSITPPVGPNSESIDYAIMRERWALPYDLFGGTKTMRKRGEIWLPREVKESKEAYNHRLQRTFLYNAFKRTIKAYVGAAFLKNITINNLPKELEYLINDCDSSGRNITSFAADICQDILITGKCHVFVDSPNVKGPVTLADVRQNNIRPYFNRIDPRDLFAWRVTYAGNKENITQIRFRERTVEEFGEWSETEILRIRIIRPGSWETYVYRATDTDSEYQPEESGNFDLEYIPLVTIYDKKEATLVSFPPLEDLAWLNLRHWQSTSDQNNILHVVRVPLLFASGFQEGELDGLEIGANRAVTTTNENAKMQHIEHTGAAIGSGRQDLKDLEVMMAHMGSDILMQKGVARQTASARQIDQVESMSVFQVVLRNMEHGLEEAIKIAGDWMGVSTEGVTVTIGEDLSLPVEPNPVESLMQLNLSEEDLLKELKRRSLISPSVENVSFKDSNAENQQLPTMPIERPDDEL
jgi:hypothetical protein